MVEKEETQTPQPEETQQTQATEPKSMAPPSASVGADPVVEVSDSTPEPDPQTETKMLSIPTSAMRKIKDDARSKGRSEALSEVAKSLGYNSWEEMDAVLRKSEGESGQEGQRRPTSSRSAKPKKLENKMSDEDNLDDETQAPPQESSQTKGHPRILKRLEQTNASLLEEKRRLSRARAHEEKRRKQVEREKAALEAEVKLRVAAAKAGVQDVDYALHLLKKEKSGMPEDESQDFDETAYFSKTLRDRHPYLYSTETQPANTGPAGQDESKDGAGAPPPAAKNPAEAAGSGDAGTIDARKLSPEDLSAHLAKLGLQDPSTGMPS